VDDKIIAVAIDDPAVSHYTHASQLPPHLTVELMRFFKDYKVLEHKLAEVEDLYGREHALEVITAARAAYRAPIPSR
jgi:inorganic pyrophosphatase